MGRHQKSFPRPASYFAQRPGIGTSAGIEQLEDSMSSIWMPRTKSRQAMESRRIIGRGEIYLVEDLHGKGHLSQGLGQFRHSLMIPID